jgi:hypothetical protein
VAFIVFNYCYLFSSTSSSITAGVDFSIVGGGGTQHGFVQSAPHFLAFFLQHPFFAFLLQDALLLLQDFEALFLLQEDFLPWQQVPVALFLQVSLHTLPVLEHFFTSSLATVFEGNKDCAFTLAIPIKNTANNTIDIFFILNNF